MNKGRGIQVLLTALALSIFGTAAVGASPPQGAAVPRSNPVMPGATGRDMLAQGMMGQGMMRGQTQPQPGASGAAIFRGQCGQCHTLVAGRSNMPGPSLYGLFGRKAGAEAGYNYSAAMRNSGVVWDAQTVDKFTEAPQRFIPGNIMPFGGITDASARQSLIDYLKTATK